MTTENTNTTTTTTAAPAAPVAPAAPPAPGAAPPAPEKTHQELRAEAEADPSPLRRAARLYALGRAKARGGR